MGGYEAHATQFCSEHFLTRLVLVWYSECVTLMRLAAHLFLLWVILCSICSLQQTMITNNQFPRPLPLLPRAPMHATATPTPPRSLPGASFPRRRQHPAQPQLHRPRRPKSSPRGLKPPRFQFSGVLGTFSGPVLSCFPFCRCPLICSKDLEDF